MYRLLSIAVTLITLVVVAACTPKYPKCDKDEHCQKKNEFCVNGMCQQCRNTKDCSKGKRCNGGRCDPIAGYCDGSSDCPDGKVCKRNRCVPCAEDTECGADGRCKSGRCLAPGQCAEDADCPENHECQDGTCVAPPTDAKPSGSDPCSQIGLTPLPTIYFDYDEFVLSSAGTQKLQEAVNCLRRVSRRVRMEGHCDARGTEEYNLALGDRRARSVKRYLLRLGAPRDRIRAVSKGKLEATGYGAGSWAKDRKVIFVWE